MKSLASLLIISLMLDGVVSGRALASNRSGTPTLSAESIPMPHQSFQSSAQQTTPDSFENIELIQFDGKNLREIDVRVVFDKDSMAVVSREDGSTVKQWKYAEIRSAEYSYTKNPRWKTGLGLGAASLVFPLLFLVAIPIGFTKHRRHWVTVRTDQDYALLKVGKSIRKVFLPAFETRTSVTIEALGDNK